MGLLAKICLHILQTYFNCITICTLWTFVRNKIILSYLITHEPKKNRADQIQTVLSKLCCDENTYIQNISKNHSENPNITIYHQQKIDNGEKMCHTLNCILY